MTETQASQESFFSREEWALERQAIRDVVDRYAHCADRREPEGQAAVFAPDGRVVLYEGDPSANEPLRTITGREELTATFAQLIAQYDVTTYLNGQSTVVATGRRSAVGETYCLASHLLHDDGERILLTMSLRYLDRFIAIDGAWFIEERRLVFDWVDRRASRP
ncbi:nuclear transport factor 2 family protein [Rathayibacter sp. VKM Ac-2759]|uniref:nuclear transport factor 2 family protein n=1 Tax=Rathayibacter sp. VKM Ac-2759 TaxID=2609252 RepID=UPI001316FBA9|nr:nuclear transport factor 2 family protein [Rathayibacter sp. VKM Ac-2759]QHC68293.1 nuclear transport factor 2 family protein [Rathayibacter sp. VKM Ac-2759]